MPQPRRRATQPAPEPDTTIRIKIEDKPYEIDLNDLDWGEIEEAEVYFDCGIDEIDWDTGRGTMFVAYLARRRVESDFLLADMKRIKANKVSLDDSPRPTDSEADDSGSQAS